MKRLYIPFLVIGVFLLTTLIVFEPFAESLNSTYFVKESPIIFVWSNAIADIMLQTFSIYAYFLTLPFFTWSFGFYKNGNIRIFKTKVIIFLINLFLIPITISLYGSKYQNIISFIAIDYMGIKANILICTLASGILYLISLGLEAQTITVIAMKVLTRFFLKLFKTYHKMETYIHDMLSKYLLKENAPPPQEKKTAIFFKEPLQRQYSKQITPSEEKVKAPVKLKQTKVAKKTASKSETPVSPRRAGTSGYSVPTDIFMPDVEEGHESLINQQEIKDNIQKIEQILAEFKITGKVIGYKVGPIITVYEFALDRGIKASKIIAMEQDLAVNMSAVSVRITTIPGKDVMGIEIPNIKRHNVNFHKIINSKTFLKSNYPLPIVLGQDTSGKNITADLSAMPHLLVAGTTGSGKSVSVNAMIISLLCKLSPEEFKLIMIDPKMLEFSVYQDIPHLLTPVVTDPEKAIIALKWVVKEMEFRYFLMSKVGVRNLTGYNDTIKKMPRAIDTTDFKHKGHSPDSAESHFAASHKMPYIVVVIDEMADLMLVAGKDVEFTVQRLAQMARAAGIHVIMSTQRPSVDVITGTIKANFPTRISFHVSSKIDSRTILNAQGAEQLLGKGDMLYMAAGGQLQRVHAPFISDVEIENLTKYLKSMGQPTYIDKFIASSNDEASKSNELNKSETDPLYQEIIDMIKTERHISTSLIQRRFSIGYNRAAKIMDQLEANKVVSKASSTGKRDILI